MEIAILIVAAVYGVFLIWLWRQVPMWKDPQPATEPATVHYLSGAWRRHWLSLVQPLTARALIFVPLALVHYAVMLPLTCVYWIAAPLLHGLDVIAMRLRRVRVKCGNAGCYKQVDLPVHICPKCDGRHRALRPGRHGLFQRRCQCGSPLPSMLVCGRHTLKTLCPHCDQPLGWTFTRDLHIVLVAGPAAGKTSLLTGIFHALRQLQRDGMVKLQFGSAEHERSFDTSLQAFQQGYVPDKTKVTLPASFVVQVVNRAREILNIHVYDVAGEVYQDRESLQSHAYFSNTDAVLFLVDPFSLRQVQQQVGERLDPYRDQVTACDEVPQHVYDRLLTVLRSFRDASKRLVDLPIAVTLTKCDAFSLDLGLAAPATTNEAQAGGSLEVRAWLEERGEGNLVRSVEHDFSKVAFFACSALGHLPQEDQKTPFEPIGVLAPLEWLLAQAGFRLRTEERRDASTRPSTTRVAARGNDLVAGANVLAWVALAASLACWSLPGMTCKMSGAMIAGLVAVLAFMRSTRVLGQGAWVAGLAVVFALVGTTAVSADEGLALYQERRTEAALAAARTMVAGEDLFTARTLLTGVLAADPSNSTARVELARVESQLVRYLLQRGEEALAAGDYDIADRSFRSASRLRDGESAVGGMKRTLDARVASLRQRGQEAVAAGDLAKGETFFREALYFDPGNKDATADLDDVLERRVAAVIAEGEGLEQQKKYDEARKRYEQALAIVPEHANAQKHVDALYATVTRSLVADGDARTARHDFDGADEKFKAVSERTDGKTAGDDGRKRVKSARIKDMLGRGFAAVKRKEFDAAIGMFNSVQKIDPPNKDAKKGLAQCQSGKHKSEIEAGYGCLSKEDYDGAKRHFENAMKLLPKSGDARKGLAVTQSKRLFHEGYVDGKKVGAEIAREATRPTSRQNLEAAVRATDWRVRQQKEGTKDEPASYREGWQVGVDNAIRAEFVSGLPPEPVVAKSEPDAPHHYSNRSAVWYVIVYDGDADTAQRMRDRALQAGLPVDLYDSRSLQVDGPPATIVGARMGSAADASAMTRRARSAGFSDAYTIQATE